jgi:hypothetical protein
MPREAKKLKPRKAQDSTEHRLRSVAIIMALCLALLIGIIAIVGPGRGRKGGTTAQTSQPAASTTPAQKAATLESVLVPPISIYRRRNIFQPQVDQDNLTAATTAASSTGVAGGGAPTRINTPAGLKAASAAPETTAPDAVTLEGVFEQDGKLYGRIRVGDTLFEKVAVGDVFGDHYRLLALGKDSSASILYGDERFTVFAGQSLHL